ncbi:MAG: YbjN domain-containing protein [Clostridia bacterium]|nr:YbjN domain-containing protein [Clostridia bacterium]
MTNYKEITMRYLDSEGIKYTDTGDFRLKIVYTGDNLKTIPVHVSFDKDGDPIVGLSCWEIANFKNKEEAGIKACNQMNCDYRWVKFYLDNDADILCSTDCYIDSANVGPMVLFRVRRIVNICDQAYPTFMRALWA